MSGYPHHYFRPSTGEFNWGQPPPPLPQPHPQFLRPNLNPSASFPSFPPSFPPPPPPQPPLPPQNLISFLQNLNTFLNTYGHQNYPAPTSNFSFPNPNPNPTPPFRPPSLSRSPYERLQSPEPSSSGFRAVDPTEVLGKIDRAVEMIRDELVAAGRSVSSWTVLQSALLRVNVDAETCLGLRIEHLPSLHRLMVTEGRINAFIHCFVKVRKIISLYDLEVAICKNEDVEHFEDLGLGPLLRHPLALHYFCVDSETSEIFKISTEEIVLLLSRYLKKLKTKEHSVEGFLGFIAKKRSVAGNEKLGIRICSLGVHTSAMREAIASEHAVPWKSSHKLKPKRNRRSRMRLPSFSVLKKRLGKEFQAISQQSESYSVVKKSREDDEGIDDCIPYEKGNDHGTGSHINSFKSLKSSDSVGKCGYLSKVEERSWLMSNNMSPSQKHNESNESVKKKRTYENLSDRISLPPKRSKKKKVEQDALPTESDSETKVVKEMLKLDLAIANNPLRMFITTWKEACREQPVAEVLWTMLCSCHTNYRRTARLMKSFTTYPMLGLLNVAVLSIKFGMWDHMSQTLFNIKNGVNTEHITEHGQSSTEEQIEFFINNSQKVPKLPDGESVRSLSHVQNDRSPQPSDWPLVGWRTPQCFGHANLIQAEAQIAPPTSVSRIEMDNDSEYRVRKTVESSHISVDIKKTTGEGTATTSAPSGLPNIYELQVEYEDGCNGTDMDTEFDPINPDFVVDPGILGLPDGRKMDHPRYGISSGRDAMLTGRLGEAVAYKYLIAKAGKSAVRWVNERIETGLPYDIVVGAKGERLEFFEVKATQNQRKDWFHISMREWQFAAEKGEAFSILHVLLLGDSAARVSVYKNPINLCQLGKLELHLMMPKKEKELFLLSSKAAPS